MKIFKHRDTGVKYYEFSFPREIDRNVKIGGINCLNVSTEINKYPYIRIPESKLEEIGWEVNVNMIVINQEWDDFVTEYYKKKN